jgi:hypothetical protein
LQEFILLSTFRGRNILDDFREAYYWLWQNTDEDARFVSVIHLWPGVNFMNTILCGVTDFRRENGVFLKKRTKFSWRLRINVYYRIHCPLFKCVSIFLLRVMSWWDYGYQIAGMANRTTLVDNNTWNNSHIALVSIQIAFRAF